MVQGQLSSEADLSVMRQDTPLADSVSYGFALGFTIKATAIGVTFSGSSSSFDDKQSKGVIRIIKKANRVAKELKEGRGLPPEEELDGILRLHVYAAKDGSAFAWYRDVSERFPGTSKCNAIKSLRAKYRGATPNSVSS